MSVSVLIIGAGAAGLSAARSLSAAGIAVTVLEARHRTGGRILTEAAAGFSVPVERGAEFVHGQLPLTLSLLKESGIGYHKTGGRMYSIRNGKPESNSPLDAHWEEVMQKMNALNSDQPLGQFLEEAFAGAQWAPLRSALRNYAEGYDAADADRISVFALREEWAAEDEGHQYRIDGGYSRLTDWLADEVARLGGKIILNSAVKSIAWNDTSVTATCYNGEVHAADCCVLAIPVGVWQQQHAGTGSIAFEPAIPVAADAFRNIGISGVIKVHLEFNVAFWENSPASGGLQFRDLGMLLSDATFPTWWTQAPGAVPLLTGWLAGPRAAARSTDEEADILAEAVKSLEYITGHPTREIESKLRASLVTNWTADPFAQGAYAWARPATSAARKYLQAGIGDRLFFAGEALYEGAAMGTVEAALHSGRETAGTILGRRAVIFAART